MKGKKRIDQITDQMYGGEDEGTLTAGGAGDIEKFKATFDDLKKSYQMREGGGNANQQMNIFVEHFYIQEINFSFTFSSSPILFREYAMNPALKFFIILMSNLKNVNLKFTAYQRTREQTPLPIFIA